MLYPVARAIAWQCRVRWCKLRRAPILNSHMGHLSYLCFIRSHVARDAHLRHSPAHAGIPIYSARLFDLMRFLAIVGGTLAVIIRLATTWNECQICDCQLTPRSTRTRGFAAPVSASLYRSPTAGALAIQRYGYLGGFSDTIGSWPKPVSTGTRRRTGKTARNTGFRSTMLSWLLPIPGG